MGRSRQVESSAPRVSLGSLCTTRAKPKLMIMFRPPISGQWFRNQVKKITCKHFVHESWEYISSSTDPSSYEGSDTDDTDTRDDARADAAIHDQERPWKRYKSLGKTEKKLATKFWSDDEIKRLIRLRVEDVKHKIITEVINRPNPHKAFSSVAAADRFVPAADVCPPNSAQHPEQMGPSDERSEVASIRDGLPRHLDGRPGPRRAPASTSHRFGTSGCAGSRRRGGHG